MIHGRIYPQVESGGLLRHELRIFVDPSSIDGKTYQNLVDIDVLRHYLRDVRDCPCRINLLVPVQSSAHSAKVYRFLHMIGVEEISEAIDITPEVEAAVGNAPQSVRILASTALLTDVDVVTTSDQEVLEHSKGFEKLHSSIGDWDFTKHACEVFVRGYEIPWSFRNPIWGTPFSAFYLFAEPYFQSLNNLYVALYRAAQTDVSFTETLEYARSLAFNRLSNICYTKDHILFYIQQRRAAKRKKLLRQDFSFEAGYFLNHYYLLFWGGLDQICWIVNAVYGLGFGQSDWRKVGIASREFLDRLKGASKELHLLFVDGDFLRWFKMLRAARHFVAHKGTAMPTTLYERPEEMPTDEELDKEIEEEGILDFEFLPLTAEILDSLKASVRYRKRIEKYREVSDDVMRLEFEGEEVFITPLLNTVWDFDQFFGFATKVASQCVNKLRER